MSMSRKGLRSRIRLMLASSISLLLMAHATAAAAQFPSREAAVAALTQAVEDRDWDRLAGLLGPEYEAFQEGQEADAALAEARTERFMTSFREFHGFVALGGDRQLLVVGAMAWPFPIPLVESGGEWRFDGAAGVEELRNRIVGANELNAIATLDLFTEAQRRYALEDRDGDGVLEFAARVISTPGTRDGLYWEPEGDQGVASPLEVLKRLSDALLGEREEGAPFLGYHFRILHGQGEHAAGGAFDYDINGHRLGGFGMLAWPAEYGETGVMSFLINQNHVVYERDLGDETATVAASIELFDPEPGWSAVGDDELR
jgi:hypothetical protein